MSNTARDLTDTDNAWEALRPADPVLEDDEALSERIPSHLRTIIFDDSFSQDDSGSVQPSEQRAMNSQGQTRFKTGEWSIGNADDFLKLTPEESAFVEAKLLLHQQLQKTLKSS
jgi:hypothetical protein